MTAQTVLITGSSSGFGRLAALHFAEKGWNVVATMRTPENETEMTKMSNVFVTRLDVQDQASVDAAVKAAVEKFGTIDVLVNNAGFAVLGPVEATPVDEIKRNFDVNFFGVIRVTQAVLPVMRKAKTGTIVNVSSVMGEMTSAFASTYGSSKWALEGWAEMMSYELLPFGIQVKLVQPGGFQTSIQQKGMLMHTEVKAENGEEYKPMLDGYQAAIADVKWADPNPAVPNAIYAAATERNAEKMRYPVYAEGDGFAQLFELRRSKGPEAQYAAVVASMQPKKEE